MSVKEVPRNVTNCEHRKNISLFGRDMIEVVDYVDGDEDTTAKYRYASEEPPQHA
jgi:hypothetical protein